ncbi:MAG TPA: GtrA family protein [Terriglobales bacterium]|jgi:putative flippase GtrA
MIRWLKFNFVGGIGIGVQLAVLTALKSGLHFNYLLATVPAVEAAVLHNFIWHERFTWKDRQKTTSRLVRFIKFNLTNGMLSILGNLGFMRLLVGVFHLNYIAANLVAITLCSLANFLISDKFVFQSNIPANPPRPTHTHEIRCCPSISRN